MSTYSSESQTVNVSLLYIYHSLWDRPRQLYRLIAKVLKSTMSVFMMDRHAIGRERLPDPQPDRQTDTANLSILPFLPSIMCLYIK